jgi:signal transduction histidine kinase/ActR/RegA family two-component response regulator
MANHDKTSYDELEQRVAERTAEIARANDRLQQEINVRIEAQEALRQSYETLLTVLDSIDADVYVADLDTYEIILVNRHMKDSFGQDLEGKSCYEVLRSESKPCAHCSNSKLLDDQGRPTGVLVWEGRNPVTGKQYINWDRAIKWTDGRFVRLQIATDVTKLRETEQEKKKLESQLLHAQRIESIGTLAGGIAHNFNNLLMSIQGNASLMLLDTDPAHPHHERLQSIGESVDNGSSLTSQLLGYARLGRYEVRPINLNLLVQETSHTFAMARREIRVHLELAEDLLGIEADQGQVEQALMNLYVNAADAMPQGGDLFLSTTNVRYEEMTGKAYHPRPGTYVLLTLKDTGVGMDQQTMDRIFEPFFTTKGLVRGTGLGLASVYGIVKSHGGYIDVESSKNQGSTFSLYLPSTEKGVTKERGGSKEIMEGKGTVLLVDDEEMVVDVGEQMLKRLGYDVVLARSGAESLKVYQDHQDRIDMVILDMIMPDMGGGETYDRLKELDPAVKVLLSSGYSIDGQATEILERGCDGFIQKPFNLGSLSQKIREVLDDFETP